MSDSHSEHQPSKPEPKLRHEFVGMMFAVAIGEVGVRTAVLVQAHNWVHFLPAYSHLLLATIVIATSWVGWTLSPSPGARHDVHRVLEWEFLVLLLDVLLVVVYFILARSVDFTGEGTIQLNASAVPETLWIFVIFCLYLVWDVLTKVVLYWKQRRQEPWFRNYGVRMLPTLLCVVLAWITKGMVETADPPHVLTADLGLLGLVLLFRALKDLISAFVSTRQVSATQLRTQRRWAIVWTVVCGLGMVVGMHWTRSWPIPQCIAVQIQTAPPEENGHSRTPAPTRQPEPRSK